MALWKWVAVGAGLYGLLGMMVFLAPPRPHWHGQPGMGAPGPGGQPWGNPGQPGGPGPGGMNPGNPPQPGPPGQGWGNQGFQPQPDAPGPRGMNPGGPNQPGAPGQPWGNQGGQPQPGMPGQGWGGQGYQPQPGAPGQPWGGQGFGPQQRGPGSGGMNQPGQGDGQPQAGPQPWGQPQPQGGPPSPRIDFEGPTPPFETEPPGQAKVVALDDGRHILQWRISAQGEMLQVLTLPIGAPSNGAAEIVLLCRADPARELLIGVRERGGAVYETTRPASGDWQELHIPLSELRPAPHHPDDNGRLDIGEIDAVVIACVHRPQLLGRGERQGQEAGQIVGLDDIGLAGGPPTQQGQPSPWPPTPPSPGRRPQGQPAPPGASGPSTGRGDAPRGR